MIDVILDRRLNQDDWRGMSEDVVDNVLTHSRFALLFEPSSRPPQPIRTEYVAYSSANSVVLNRWLDNPVVTSQLADFDLDEGHVQLLLSQPFPCDTQLVNIKSYAASSLDCSKPAGMTGQLQVFMTLRKIVTECIYSANANNDDRPCDRKATTMLNLTHYFVFKSPPMSVQRTSLTGRVSGNLTLASVLQLKDMELQTVELKLLS